VPHLGELFRRGISVYERTLWANSCDRLIGNIIGSTLSADVFSRSVLCPMRKSVLDA
jgi:hypothetical protein